MADTRTAAWHDSFGACTIQSSALQHGHTLVSHLGAPAPALATAFALAELPLARAAAPAIAKVAESQLSSHSFFSFLTRHFFPPSSSPPSAQQQQQQQGKGLARTSDATNMHCDWASQLLFTNGRTVLQRRASRGTVSQVA